MTTHWQLQYRLLMMCTLLRFVFSYWLICSLHSCVKVMSILHCASETWMLLAADIRRLEAFHTRCLRQLLNITWQDHITNEAILMTTGLMPLQLYPVQAEGITVQSCLPNQPRCSYTSSPTDTDGPLHWSKARCQMATDTWSIMKDLMLPDLDWCPNVTS